MVALERRGEEGVHGAVAVVAKAKLIDDTTTACQIYLHKLLVHRECVTHKKGCHHSCEDNFVVVP
jgi:hypothetical protein